MVFIFEFREDLLPIYEQNISIEIVILFVQVLFKIFGVQIWTSDTIII